MECLIPLKAHKQAEFFFWSLSPKMNTGVNYICPLLSRYIETTHKWLKQQNQFNQLELESPYWPTQGIWHLSSNTEGVGVVCMHSKRNYI